MGLNLAKNLRKKKRDVIRDITFNASVMEKKDFCLPHAVKRNSVQNVDGSRSADDDARASFRTRHSAIRVSISYLLGPIKGPSRVAGEEPE